MTVIVHHARCWPCMFDQCQQPPRPHTWMDSLLNANPCACWCAGGDDPCHTNEVPDE